MAPTPFVVTTTPEKRRAKPSEARPSKFLVLLSVSQRQQDPLDARVKHRAFSGGELSFELPGEGYHLANPHEVERRTGALFDDKGGVRRVNNSELLATSLTISFAACFPLKMMCSCLPPTPCTKISQGFPCPHGFLAQDVHGALLLDLQRNRSEALWPCMPKCCCYRYQLPRS